MAAAPAPTVWSVVRDILTANLTLSADEVIGKARVKGVKAPDADIRTTVYNVRKKLKQKAAALAPKPAPVAARTTAAPAAKAGPATSPVVRAILSADPALPADAVIARAKAKGVTAPDDSIRNAVHNIRAELKKAGAGAAPAPKVAAPARKAAPPRSQPAPEPVVTPPSPAVGVSDVLSNVALVNAAVAAAGGVEQARQVAAAVKACGGPEAFAQYLDLVAGIRTG